MVTTETPQKKTAQIRDCRETTVFTRRELDLLKEAAWQKRLTKSAFCRLAILELARQVLKLQTHEENAIPH